MFPLGFADAREISGWADEAVQWAVMNRPAGRTRCGNSGPELPDRRGGIAGMLFWGKRHPGFFAAEKRGEHGGETRIPRFRSDLPYFREIPAPTVICG